MSCEACETAWEKPEVYPYRWRRATVSLIACREHTLEIFEALNGVQEVE